MYASGIFTYTFSIGQSKVFIGASYQDLGIIFGTSKDHQKRLGDFPIALGIGLRTIITAKGALLLNDLKNTREPSTEPTEQGKNFLCRIN